MPRAVPVPHTLAHTPAVARRLSDRAARAWEIGWTAAVLVVIVTSMTMGAALDHPFLTLIGLASVAASSALTIAVSPTDGSLILSVAPGMLLLGVSATETALALGIWTAAYFVGAVVRLRQVGDAAELTAYMVGAAFVTIPVWLWFESRGVPWVLSVPASVALYVLVRMTISVIRQSIVTTLGLRRVIGDILVSRALLTWVIVSAVTIAALWLMHAASSAAGDGPEGAAFGGVVALMVLGSGAFTAGILRELNLSARRLKGTLRAAVALPWETETPIDEHALAFARRALPRYTIELRETVGRNSNEIVTPLTDGYLVARRGAAQAPFLVRDQRVLEAIAHIADTMAAARRERESLERAAATDELTGLPNYRGFYKLLERSARRGADTPGLAIVYVDIDGFKEVNDRYGHEAGNVVLRTIATRMQAALIPDRETIARIGGDEFALIIDDADDEETARARADEILRAASAPVLVGTTVMAVALSSGVAFSGADRADLGGLLAAADSRMYATRGRSLAAPIALIDDTASVPVIHPGGDVVELVTAIAAAIRERRLTLVYQPIVDRVEDRIIALEALVRPGEPQLRGLSADVIVHEARRLDLLTALSTHVLTTAVADLRRFHAVVPDLVDVHVNIDVEQLTDPVFVETLREQVCGSGIVVTLELSESSLNRTSDKTRAAVATLRDEAGVRVALDDFGQQFSTLLSIVENPIDVLKIDKALPRDLPAPRSRVVMRSMATLARSLDVQMVVEGVESDEMYDELVGVGVRYMQGYRFGAALSAELMAARLERSGLRAYTE
ncbi:EAL domain-containing protein [Microbacterium sp.]|uniref:EAL domain-containing protein n=1 Tax=Microbacterium sp. TaxID=51671 RepID=UPI003C750F00